MPFIETGEPGTRTWGRRDLEGNIKTFSDLLGCSEDIQMAIPYKHLDPGESGTLRKV